MLNLTELYAVESSGILGRDEVMQQVFLTLLRVEKPNVILTGDPGVGKTSVVHLLADLIAKKQCPKWLQGYHVLEVNTNALLAGPGYRGITEEKFENVIRSAVGKKVILFFDEFHTVAHLGEMANGQTPGLGNTLKPYLTRSDFRVIGATTSDEVKSITDKALLRRFTQIEVGEPTDEALLSICERVFPVYSRGKLENQVNFREVVDFSKSLTGFNPDKLKNILDVSIAKAKFENSTFYTADHVNYAMSMLGVRKVDETDINEQF